MNNLNNFLIIFYPDKDSHQIYIGLQCTLHDRDQPKSKVPADTSEQPVGDKNNYS